MANTAAHLAGFRGVLQVDGYGGFKALQRDRDDGEVVLAFCWAHLRRRFFDIHAATQSPIAAEALLRIAALYAIEAGIVAARRSNAWPCAKPKAHRWWLLAP